MASAPQSPQLPLFYNDLTPLNSNDHRAFRSRSTHKATWLANQHAVPLTVEEFPMALRNYPIIFSQGPNPVPLALMGLNEGVNVFVSEEGVVDEGVYVPAYVRRYPFMLAKLRPDSDEMSLCFDPTTDLIGDFEDGVPLFDGEEPSEACRNSLNFCEQFEIAGQKTAQFVTDLNKHGLLIDGELGLRVNDLEQPFVYQGFRMVDENKLKDLRGDVLRSWAQSGMLPLIYAHLFSLDLARDIFSRQVQQGKGPAGAPQPKPEPANN